MSEALKKALLDYRNSKDLNQEQMASLIGVSYRNYQNIESTGVVKKVDVLENIKNVTGYDDTQIIASNGDVAFSFTQKRQSQKLKSTPFMVPFVPVKAQAGYVKAVDQEIYLDTLEKFQLPPGVNPHGAIWRYWEIEGDSMEPEYRNGDMLLTSQVHQMDWENMRNFYAYVIVTNERVLFKRIFCKNDMEWVLISDNEENYPQQLLPVEYIKEVWVVRRRISNNIPVPKRFEITV